MLRKSLKFIAIVMAVSFALVQFIRPDRSNPVENSGDVIESSTHIPSEVATILSRSCADCHTHRTVWPWYSNISPVSWFLKNHIDHGRSHLNLSVWNTYTDRQKARKLDELCETVESGEMPLPSYLWIHHDAALKAGEAEILCNWANTEKARLEALIE